MSTTTASVHRWDEMDFDTPMDLIERRRIIGQHAMISHVALKQGCLVPTHAHENEQFVCMLNGALRFLLGPEDSEQAEITLKAGEVLHLPANVPHQAEALVDSLVLDIFSPPSETTGIDRS